MSRAFVKDDDGMPDKPLAVPQTDHPNYVTPKGLEQLRERLARARSAGEASQIEHLESRVESAIVVDPREQPTESVNFGATVRIEEPDRSTHIYSIVGEDEADPLHGSISWISPLAQALLDKRTGDRAIWRRPAGDLSVRVLGIEYR
ncbi:MAG TPA: GreA/GreB family elongation factor [Candidatus Baltobacteraceae bacterium]|jgi:transcription elongation GreA/GreB family factor